MQSYRRIQNGVAAFPIAGTAALRPRQHRGLVMLEGGATAQRRLADMHVRREGRLRPHTLVLGALLVCVLSVGALILSGITSAAAAQQALDRADTVTIAVRQGDSLWGIAHEHGIAGVDDGRIVSWIEQHNGVSADGLVPGQKLVIPTSTA